MKKSYQQSFAQRMRDEISHIMEPLEDITFKVRPWGKPELDIPQCENFHYEQKNRLLASSRNLKTSHCRNLPDEGHQQSVETCVDVDACEYSVKPPKCASVPQAQHKRFLKSPGASNIPRNGDKSAKDDNVVHGQRRKSASASDEPDLLKTKRTAPGRVTMLRKQSACALGGHLLKMRGITPECVNVDCEPPSVEKRIQPAKLTKSKVLPGKQTPKKSLPKKVRKSVLVSIHAKVQTPLPKFEWIKAEDIFVNEADLCA